MTDELTIKAGGGILNLSHFPSTPMVLLVCRQNILVSVVMKRYVDTVNPLVENEKFSNKAHPRHKIYQFA